MSQQEEKQLELRITKFLMRKQKQVFGTIVD